MTLLGIVLLGACICISFKLGRGWEVMSIETDLKVKGVSRRPYGDFNKHTITIIGTASRS